MLELPSGSHPCSRSSLKICCNYTCTVLCTSVNELMTSVKELVTSVKELVTLGKTKTGMPSGACELYQVCFANGSCLDVKDLSEWVLLGMISIWIGWLKTLYGRQDAT